MQGSDCRFAAVGARVAREVVLAVEAAVEDYTLGGGFACGGEVGIKLRLEVENRTVDMYGLRVAARGLAPRLDGVQRLAVALLPQPSRGPAVEVALEAVAVARGGVFVYEEVVGRGRADEVVGYGVVAAVLRQAQFSLRLAEGPRAEVVADERVVDDGATFGAAAV